MRLACYDENKLQGVYVCILRCNINVKIKYKVCACVYYGVISMSIAFIPMGELCG